MQSTVLGLLALFSASAPLASALSIGQITNNVPAAMDPTTASQKNGANSDPNLLDGMALDQIPESRSAETIMSEAITPAAWTATADSFQPGYPPSNVLDGKTTTFWHTPFGENGKALPHTLTIDMKQAYLINSIAYIPRQDGVPNGNIGEHTLQTSLDGETFSTPVALGTYADSVSTKTTLFEATRARFVRLTALTEAGGRGPWSSCASLSIFQTSTPAPASGEGEWSPTIDFPLVPVSMAVEHDSGNILVWSSYAASTFGGSPGGNTLTASYNPATGIVSQRNISNTDHDMFCEGLSIDSSGRFFATGGNNAPKFSIYSPRLDAWSAGPEMNIARGYQAQATLSNGNIFVIGGSWSGGTGGKEGEVYEYTTNTWNRLLNARVQAMYTNDRQGVYRADNHGWLFGWKEGYVFQAGPSRNMNWYGTNIEARGSQNPAGTRGNDGDAMCGNAIMYDAVAGNILTVGGALDYQGIDSTSNAHIITIGNPLADPVKVTAINPMWFQRIFANAVVLPNGNVFITGGQVFGQPFSDATSQLVPEMWDPVTTRFTKLASQNIPRNYHSAAILMPDATILSGGGGLCGACATNHYDAQIYSPAYLFNLDGSRATRPVIVNAPGKVEVGGVITASTNIPVTAWSMIRLGSTTHTVNTDQRRIPLTATARGNTYTMKTPGDAGIMIPGYYYLFASTGAGVPSIAKFVWVPVPGTQ